MRFLYYYQRRYFTSAYFFFSLLFSLISCSWRYRFTTKNNKRKRKIAVRSGSESSGLVFSSTIQRIRTKRKSSDVHFGLFPRHQFLLEAKTAYCGLDSLDNYLIGYAQRILYHSDHNTIKINKYQIIHII